MFLGFRVPLVVLKSGDFGIFLLAICESNREKLSKMECNAMEQCVHKYYCETALEKWIFGRNMYMCNV